MFLFQDPADLASFLGHPRACGCHLRTVVVPLLSCSVFLDLDPGMSQSTDFLHRLGVHMECVCLSLPLRLLWSKMVSLQNLLELNP